MLQFNVLTGKLDQYPDLPAGALEVKVTVANLASRYQLTALQAQNGDFVLQSDTNVLYLVTDQTNLANANGYTALTSLPWSAITGLPDILQNTPYIVSSVGANQPLLRGDTSTVNAKDLNGVYSPSSGNALTRKDSSTVVPADIGAAPSGAVAATAALSISITGAWGAPYPFLIRSGYNFQLNGTLYTSNSGKWIDSFTYAYDIVGVAALTGLTFTDLAGVVGAFTPTISYVTSLSLPALVAVGGNFLPVCPGSALTSLSAPNLVWVGGNLGLAAAAALTTVSLPNLNAVGGAFFTSPNGGGITSISAPNLVSVGGAIFSGSTMNSLTSVNLTSLQTIGGPFAFPTGVPAGFTSLNFAALVTVYGGLNLSGAPGLASLSIQNLVTVLGSFTLAGLALTSVSGPSLTTVVAAFSVASDANLMTVSFPAMVSWGSTFTLLTALGNVTTVSIGVAGTLKSCGGNVTVQNQKLTQASVDGILSALASLDGTNGTTVYASKTVNLSGGSSPAPTFTGATVSGIAGSAFSAASFTHTVTLASHGYSNGDLLTIANVGTIPYANGSFVITYIDSGHFSYQSTSSEGGTGSGSTVTITKAGNTTEGYYFKQRLLSRQVSVVTN